MSSDLPTAITAFVCDHCKKTVQSLVLITDATHDYNSDKVNPNVCMDCMKNHDDVRECLFVLARLLIAHR